MSHFNGLNKIYDTDDGKGFPKESKLCDIKGYIYFLVSPFTTYKRTKRVWPFSNKGVIPNDYKACRSKGYFPLSFFFISFIKSYQEHIPSI